VTDANGAPGWRDRAALLIFALAAGIGIIWTISNIREVLRPSPPSGGIGAVSIAVVPTVLVLTGPILVNWFLRGAALRYGPLARRFRRMHLWLTLTYLVWEVVSMVWFLRGYPAGAETFYETVNVINVIAAPFGPLQMFFAASVFAFFIRGKRPNGRAAVVSQTEE
jgi:hypothetical protein